MNYTRKALKDLVAKLRNEYNMQLSIQKLDRGMRNYYLNFRLEEDDSKAICIRIAHLTKKELNEEYSINGKYYLTEWGELSEEMRNAVRRCREKNIPVISIKISIWYISSRNYRDWMLGEYRGYRSGYKCIDEKLFEDIKRTIEEIRGEYANRYRLDEEEVDLHYTSDSDSDSDDLPF